MIFKHPLHRQLISRQHGVATLFITLIALFLVTLVTLFANKGAVFEQVTSANHYRYSLAFEAAQGGLEYTVAWLGASGKANGSPYSIATGGTGAVWISDSTYFPYDQKNTTSIAAQTLGNYTATVALWRSSAKPNLVEINSVATGEATATVKQIVNVNALNFTTPNLTPLVINGCISAVAGNPSVTAASPAAVAIVSSAASACLNSGHFNISGQTIPNAFAGTAWAQVFGSSSKSDMLALAQAQPNGQTGGPIYYYDFTNSSPSDPWHTSLGTSDQPVILIFDNVTGSDCPKISGGGGVTIYGIVYCNSGLDMQGWGGANIIGSLVTDSAITKFAANTSIMHNPNAAIPTSYPVNPVISKVSGTWRDL